MQMLVFLLNRMSEIAQKDPNGQLESNKGGRSTSNQEPTKGSNLQDMFVLLYFVKYMIFIT